MVSHTAYTHNTDIGTFRYLVAGDGPNTAVCFHGFGQSAEVFFPLASFGYRIITINLPHHNGSYLQPQQKDEAINANALCGALIQILEHCKANNYHLYGYSIGCRFAMALYLHCPQKVTKLILLAPDCFRQSFIVRLATWSATNRAAFRYVLAKPESFFKLLRGIANLGIIDTKLERFIEHQMGTNQKRTQVYLCWVHFRALFFTTSHVANALLTHKTPTNIVKATHDHLANRYAINTLSEYSLVGSNLIITQLDASHTALLQHYFRQLLPTK